MFTKYRKKPVVIEAFQYDGDFMDKDGNYYVPKWAVKALKRQIMEFREPELFIKTLEGEHHAEVGDYIIKGVKGELYPCKPDIFEMTYDVAGEERFINIKWQEGTIPERGINGSQIVDVIQAALDRTIEMNDLYPCRENKDTIMMLEQAILHQNNRTRDRRVRKVEGTYQR